MPTLDARRSAATGSIKTVARRRILAIADLSRQSNDNALLAGLALQRATGTGDVDEQQAGDALARRAAIDAIRAASNALKAAVATMSAADLAGFAPDAAEHWPSRSDPAQGPRP